MARGTTRSPRKKAPPPRAGFSLPGWLWALLGIVGGVFITKHFFSQAPAPVQQPAAVVNRPATPVQQPPTQPAPAQAVKGKGKAQPAQQATTQAPAEAEQPNKNDMPTFEFYTLLPASEVVAPGENTPATAKQRTQPAQAVAPQAARPQTQPQSAPQAAAKQAPVQPTQAPAQQPPARSAPTPASADSTAAKTILQAASFRSRDDANSMAGKFRDMGLVTQVIEVKTADGNHWYRVQSGPYTNQAELARAQGLMQARGVNPMVMRQR